MCIPLSPSTTFAWRCPTRQNNGARSAPIFALVLIVKDLAWRHGGRGWFLVSPPPLSDGPTSKSRTPPCRRARGPQNFEGESGVGFFFRAQQYPRASILCTRYMHTVRWRIEKAYFYQMRSNRCIVFISNKRQELGSMISVQQQCKILTSTRRPVEPWIHRTGHSTSTSGHKAAALQQYYVSCNLMCC